MLEHIYAEKLGQKGLELVQASHRSAIKIKNLVNGIIDYYRSESVAQTERETFKLNEFLRSIVDVVIVNTDTQVIYPNEAIEINANKVALEHIVINLLSNAVKYNDKEKPLINISFSEDDVFYKFNIEDNGVGIQPDNVNKIFNLFTTLKTNDRFGEKGTGIGLSLVKKLIDNMGGNIHVTSTPGVKTAFNFTVRKP